MLKALTFQFLTISNFFTNIFILFVLSFFGHLELSSEGFVLISFINIFTHGFSANIRNILLGSKENFEINNIIKKRILVSLISILFAIIFSKFVFDTKNIFLLFGLSVLTIINWILEIYLAHSEKIASLNKFHLLAAIFLIFISPFLIMFNYLNLLAILIIIIPVINLFIYKFKYKKIKIIKNLKGNAFFDLAHTSTLIKTFSNFSWKFLLLYFLGKSNSSLLFIAFSFGSFFGTLFDISYGAHFLKRLKNIKIFINSFYITYAFIIFIIISFYYYYSDLNQDEFKILKHATIYSIIGSYFMIFALKKRQQFFEIKKMINTCYKFDIISYVFNLLVIPVIFLINLNYLNFAYLLSSIFLFILYKIIELKNDKKKIL